MFPTLMINVAALGSLIVGSASRGVASTRRHAPCDSVRLCGADRPPVNEVLNRLSPVNIAYLGDSVWECEARERLLWPPSKVDTLSSSVQRLCCAEGQYDILQRIEEGFGLTEAEQDWLRRGRNASGRGPRRLAPKVYRASTAFETLIGVLYLSDTNRLAALFEFIFATQPEDVSSEVEG